MKAKHRRVLSFVLCALLVSALLPSGAFAAGCNHNYEPYSAVVPTCEEEGYTVFRCTICGDTYEGEQMPALGHKYSKVWEAYNEELHEKICSRCGGAKREAHTWVLDEQLSREPTEDYSGFAVYNCSKCNDQKVVYLPKLEHEHYYTVYEVVEPTCTTGGYTTFICYTCGNMYDGDETEPLGHDWDEGRITKEPTCTATGRRRCTCRRDSSHISIENVPALGHEWDAGTVTTPPTTTQEGVMTYACVRCTSTQTQPIRKRVPGDANADDRVDLRDVVTIRRALAGWENYTLDPFSADVTGDNDVDLADVTQISRYLGGWKVSLL